MPLCLRRVGIGAGQREDVVGEVAGRRPDLLAVEDPLVAVERGPQGEAAEVRAGVRLGVPLAPAVGAGQDARQVVRLLLVGAPHQQRVAEHLDAEHVVRAAGGDAGLGELLGDDHLLERRQPAAAVLDGPAGRQVAGLVQHVAPRRDEVAQLGPLQLADAAPSRSAASRPGTPGPCRGTPRHRRSRRGPSPVKLLVHDGPVPSGPGRRRRPAAPPSPAGTARCRPGSRLRSVPARRWVSLLRCSSSRRAASTSGRTERRRHRPGQHDEAQVEHRDGRGDRPTDHRARPLDDRRRRAAQWAVRLLLDRRRRRVGHQAPLGTTRARVALGLDDDVAELAEVAVPAAQQAAVADDTGLDGVGHQHGHDVGRLLAAHRSSVRRRRAPHRRCRGRSAAR